MREEEAVYLDCFFCGSKFQFGPHRYDGSWNPTYRLPMCSGCYRSNWDGLNPGFGEKLIRHLEKEGIPKPAKNEKGLFPRGI